MDTQVEKQLSGVNITITAPSDNEAERPSSSDDEDDYIYSDDGDHTLSDDSDSNVKKTPELEQNETKDSQEDEEKLCDDFQSSVTVCEEKPASLDEKQSSENGEKSNYEIVGDRVLVERDGKFELVDANEIKAEYFEMLGIKPEETEPRKNDEKGGKLLEGQAPHKPQERPKTTPVRSSRERETQVNSKRAQSSWGHRTRSNEYGHIRSPYGLTDKQLEIKRRREDAIAKRKKEEEEMAREEEKRRREDAERAFQAWLNSKREEKKERQRNASKEEPEDTGQKASETVKAVKAWKASKKRQQQQEQHEAQRRMEETASMYVVHDRDSCEEAFKRWRRRKRAEQKAKEQEKKKRPKSRRKPKEPLPVNSAKIRFTDNYGYRNTVVY